MTPLRRQKGTGMDLTKFLLARIAEDERRWGNPAFLRVSGPDLSAMVLWVRAECQAKRRIVRRYLAGDDLPPDYETGPGHVPHWYERESEALGNDVLCLLALPYADHPDYQQEWRP